MRPRTIKAPTKISILFISSILQHWQWISPSVASTTPPPLSNEQDAPPRALEIITCTSPFTLLPNQRAIVNDGYCDCIDGRDEPLTDACSGVDHWAGAKGGRNIATTTTTATSTDRLYKCPQQKLYLPPSRIHDGICDCCCGSDERGVVVEQGGRNDAVRVVCEDVCDQVLREERLERQMLEEKFAVGYRERNRRVEEFQGVVQEAFGKMTEMRQELKSMEDSVQGTRDLLKRKQEEMVVSFLAGVRERNRDVLEKDSSGIFHRILDQTWDKKVEFLAAVCQWYGEMTLSSHATVSNRLTFCEPLRWAALDAGILWDGKELTVPKGWGEELVQPLWTRFGYASQQEIEKEEEEWVDPEDEILSGDDYYNKEGRVGVRGDDDGYDDDDYGPYEGETMRKEQRRHGQGNDDDDDDGGIHDKHMGSSQSPRETNENHPKDHQHQYHHDEEESFQSIFGKVMRSNFHQQAKDIVNRIDMTMKAQTSSEERQHDDDDDDQQQQQQQQQQEQQQLSSVPVMDPMAMQMVRNVLSGRIGQIEYGNDLAKSAFSMMKSLQDVVDSTNLMGSYMDTLLISTVDHSKIGQVDVEEILAVIHADLSSQSCFSPYSVLCSTNDASTIQNENMAQRCAERSEITVCAASARPPANDHTNEEPLVEPIPSHIADGFGHYYTPKARETNDYFTKLLYESSTKTLQGHRWKEESQIPQLDIELNKATQQVEKIKNDIKKIKDDLGLEQDGRNGSPKYGMNGELYALRDQCFSIASGKYTYEVCLFQRAYQREGAAKTGGTDLGKWHSASMDEASGTRIWKWTGGAKCWNGPSRSATVFVTCGPETRIISADEPNICEYEFKMESYIACDDRYKIAHEL